MQKDPYYCLQCGHKGEHDGIIGIMTPCGECGSQFIMPLASMHIVELESMDELEAYLRGEAPKSQKRKHLKLLPGGPDENEKKG